MKRSAIYNAYRTGVVSAKVALAFAQVLDVSPFYYTGEEKTKQKLQEALLLLFLQKHGYTKLLAELGEAGETKQPAKRGRKTKSAQTSDTDSKSVEILEVVHHSESSTCEQICTELTLPDSDSIRRSVSEMTTDDAIVLLMALFVRGKAGGQAAEYAETVKRLLLM